MHVSYTEGNWTAAAVLHPPGHADRCAEAVRLRQRRLALTLLLITGAIAGLSHVAPARAADCLQPSAAGAAVRLRAAPSTSSAILGKLSSGTTAPLIATIPRWYETRTPADETAFVSKQSTDVVPCPPASPTVAATSTGAFELHAIDVGTGLAILVRGPDFVLLFDGGSNDDFAIGDDNRVVAYLHTLKPSITRIDDLLLSHPHRDHVELLPDVFAKFDVGKVWNSGAYNDICGYRHFLEAIAVEPAVEYHTATQGAGNETVVLGKKKCYATDEPEHSITLLHQSRIDDTPISLGEGASMTILHADGSKRPSFNENSLVVRLDLGPHKVLLMGDAEAGGRKSPSELPTTDSIEGKLLACCKADLKADVLVVGHHGSKTSSRTAFINAVGARFFIISSGPTRYGSVTLPDDEIVNEFSSGDLFRTDIEDDQCAQSSDKIGPDADAKAGGCDNIVIMLPASGPITGAIQQGSD